MCAVLEFVTGGQMMDWNPSDAVYEASPTAVAAAASTGSDADKDVAEKHRVLPESVARRYLRDMVTGLAYCTMVVHTLRCHQCDLTAVYLATHSAREPHHSSRHQA